MLQGKRLTFDEESRALYDAVAPRHTEAEFAGRPRKLEARLPGDGPLIERYEAFKQATSSSRATRLDQVFQAAIAPAATRTPSTSSCPPGESFTVEYVTGQVVERLQLVSGQLPQPDPGEHRPADLHRSRHRPGVSRGLSRPSRLQRAAREAPRARPRLDGVHGLSAVLAAVADCRRDGQLRHRGGVLRRPSGWRSSATCCSRWPGSTRRARRSTTRCWRWSISCRYAGNEAARRYLDGQIDAQGGGRLAGRNTR